jgi:hypothetical protein
MEYNELSVVVSTPKTQEESQEFIQHIYQTCGCNVHVFLCMNNGTVGLNEVYNKMLNDENVNKNIIVFMHDDIDLLKIGWGREILRLFKENEDYGIIGVAGTKQFDALAMWWQFPKRYGQVVHKAEGKCWLTSFSPLLQQDLQEVAVVDGLFFGVHPERIKKKFRTDVNGFDFYEICLCLDNAIEGVKIGVTTNIRICHHSIGKMRENWYKNREIVNRIYGKYYPIDLDEGIKIKNDDVEAYLKIKYDEIKKIYEENVKRQKEAEQNKEITNTSGK